MKEQIKKLRISIDGLAQLTKELKLSKKEIIGTNTDIIGSIMTFNGWRDINSKEIEKAVDSLYLGKAWLGKVLGELGNENPYGSGYKTKEDIVPTQDVAKKEDNGDCIYPFLITVKEYENKNHIEKVDWLRTEIESLVKEVIAIPVGETVRIIDIDGVLPEQQKFSAFSREFAIARTNCYTHLCEARFWLGFECERIKNEK